MSDEEEEARVRRNLQDMKKELAQNVAAQLQTQLKKQTLTSETAPNQLSVANRDTVSRISPNLARTRAKRVTLTNVAAGKRGGKAGPGGVKRIDYRPRAHYPWRQVPERIKRTTFSSGKRTKIRGEAAKAVHIPFIFRMCSNYYVQFGGETMLCLFCYIYFFVTTYQAFFDLHDTAATRLILLLDFVFLTNFLARLILEWWRYVLGLEYIVLFIPCTCRFWIISLITFAPVDHIMSMLLGDSLADLERLDWFRWIRWIFLPYYVQVFFCKAGKYFNYFDSSFIK